MEIINIIINLATYLAVPLLIRYVFYKKPIQRKWVAISILLPLFIIFAWALNVIRESAIPGYQHMIGSPLLWSSMIASYFILTKK